MAGPWITLEVNEDYFWDNPPWPGCVLESECYDNEAQVQGHEILGVLEITKAKKGLMLKVERLVVQDDFYLHWANDRPSPDHVFLSPERWDKLPGLC